MGRRKRPEGNRRHQTWPAALAVTAAAAALVNAGLLSPWLAQALARVGLVAAAAALTVAGLTWARAARPVPRAVAGGGAPGGPSASLARVEHWSVSRTPSGVAGMALVLALAVWGAGDGFLLPGQRVVPVLTYHRVTQPLRRRYPVPVTSPSDFAWQMAWLATHGYRTIDPERLTGARGAWPPKPMVITFDDGWRDNLGAARVMRRHGYTGVVFVVSGDLGRSLTLRPADLGTLERLGLRVGSHTVTHPHLDRLDEAARRRELLTSRLALERLLGHPVDLFASPYGSADLTPDLAALARRTGYRLAFASHNFGLNASAPSPYAVRRVLIPSNRLLARLEFLALLW